MNFQENDVAFEISKLADGVFSDRFPSSTLI